MSSSSSGYRRKYGHHGSGHYKKRSFFGDMFNMFSSGSGSRRDPYGDPYGYPNNNPNFPNQQAPSQPIYNSGTMTCSKCNAQIPAGSKFCLQCGEKVSDGLFCMNCGEKLPPDAKFCLKCGSKVNG